MTPDTCVQESHNAAVLMGFTPPPSDWIKLLHRLLCVERLPSAALLWTRKERVRIRRPNVCVPSYSLIDFSEFREEPVSINWPAPMLAAPYGEVWL